MLMSLVDAKRRFCFFLFRVPTTRVLVLHPQLPVSIAMRVCFCVLAFDCVCVSFFCLQATTAQQAVKQRAHAQVCFRVFMPCNLAHSCLVVIQGFVLSVSRAVRQSDALCCSPLLVCLQVITVLLAQSRQSPALRSAFHFLFRLLPSCLFVSDCIVWSLVCVHNCFRLRFLPFSLSFRDFWCFLTAFVSLLLHCP